jgi:hypothetical protein
MNRNSSIQRGETDRHSIDPIVYVAIAAVGVHSLAIVRNNVTFSPFPLLWLTGLGASFTIALSIGHLCRALLTGRAHGSRARHIRVFWLSVLLALIGLFVFSPGGLFCWPLANQAFRWTADVGKIQAWSQQVLSKQADGFLSSRTALPQLPRSDLPDFVRNIGPGPPTVSVILMSGDRRTSQRREGREVAEWLGGPSSSFVSLSWGRGGEERGILIGPPSFRIQSTSHRQVYSISQGVYRFQDR